MLDYFRGLFPSRYMPHGHCYFWEDGLVWTHGVSDALIGLAYVAITATLLHLIRRTQLIPFLWVYVAFAVFILACGMTHLVAVWNLWMANYWLGASVKVVTAAASVGTALLLPPLVPKILELVQNNQRFHQRGRELEAKHGELQRAHAELRQAQTELEERTRHLEAANRMKDEFLANMSHELRTPLNAVIGFSELLHDEKVGPLQPQQKEFMGDILTSARHLLGLINEVLDLAKVEAGRIELHPEPVDVALVVGEVRDVLRGHAQRKSIQVEVEIEAGLEDVILDPSRFKQVLYNYLSNALKFTPDEGRVAVRLRPEGERALRLEVSDSGPGIAPEDVERLFVPFQQLDQGTTKRHPGTGLGLALTKRLVEEQGGEVGVTSQPGAGSTFYARLPRRPQLRPHERERS